MKQKIRLKARTQTIETKETEVEFPIYREHALDNCTIYTKRISTTETIDIHENEDGTFQIELSESDDMRHDCSRLDYQLGTGEYASSRENFEEAFAKAKALLARFA